MDFFRSLYTRLSKYNVAHLLILGLVVKAIVQDVSYPAVLICIPILGYEAYKLYLKHKTPEPVKIDEAIVKELDNIKSKLNAQTFEKSVKPETRRYF